MGAAGDRRSDGGRFSAHSARAAFPAAGDQPSFNKTCAADLTARRSKSRFHNACFLARRDVGI
jgi:hypothetical protein